MGLIDLFKTKSAPVVVIEEPKQLEFKAMPQIDISDMINNGYTYGGNIVDKALINEGYASNADVYAITKKVAETAAGIPLIVEQRTKKGWEIDTESELNALLANPNKKLTGDEFRFNSGIFLLNAGDTFWKTSKDASFGLVTELEILGANLVDIVVDSSNNPVGYRYYSGGVERFTYSLDEVIHSKYINPSLDHDKVSNRGLSPLQAGYNILQSSNNRSVATANMIKNGGAYGILSSGSDMAVSSLESERVQKQVNTRRGGANGFGSILTSMDNFKFVNIGMDANQLKMIEGGLVDLRTLCNLYSVDSTMFNDKASSTLDNVKVANKKLYTDAAIPLNKKYILEFTKHIIPTYNAYEGKELRIVQDLSNIDALQQDQAMKAEKNAKNIASLSTVIGLPISIEGKVQVLITQMGMEESMARQIIGKETI